MKRRLLKLGLFLVAGAIVNVAVAWGCVLNPWQSKQQASQRDLSDELAWAKSVVPQGMSEPTYGGCLTIPGVEQIILMGESRAAADLLPNAMLIEQVIRMRAGFPLHSCSGTMFNYVLPTTNRTTYKLDMMILPPGMLISKRVEYQRPIWPFAPIWLGFAINTVFYAVFV